MNNIHELEKSSFQQHLGENAQTIKDRRKRDLDSERLKSLTSEQISVLPQIDRETRRYTDAGGKSWVPNNFFRQEYNFDAKHLGYTEDTQWIIGRRSNGLPVILYDEEVVANKIHEIKALPQVDTKTERYTDESGQQWVAANYFARKYGIRDSKIIASLSSQVQTLPGRGLNNRPILLLNEDEVLSLSSVQEYLNLEKLRADNGLYQDEEGKLWISDMRLAEGSGLMQVPQTILGNIPFRIGKGIGGKSRIRKLYDADLANEALRRYLSLPRVDTETGIYRDSDGKQWVSINFIHERTGISHPTIRRLIEGVSVQPGRDRTNDQTDLYDLSRSLNLMQDFLSLPMVDKTTKQYIDDEERKWMTFNAIGKLLGFSIGSQLAKSVKEQARVLRGRDPIGHEANLFEVSEISLLISEYATKPKQRENKQNIDTSEADSYLRNLVFGEYEDSHTS